MGREEGGEEVLYQLGKVVPAANVDEFVPERQGQRRRRVRKWTWHENGWVEAAERDGNGHVRRRADPHGTTNAEPPPKAFQFGPQRRGRGGRQTATDAPRRDDLQRETTQTE
jgi:hypothetical protein